MSAADEAALACAGAVLTIDLDAVAENYARLQARLGASTCAAVVKADGYGLGAARVAPALARAGTRHFFTAQLDEAIALCGPLADWAEEVEIYVLNGLGAGPPGDFLDHGLRPVLNSLGELEVWQAAARAAGRPLAAALHLDSGMCRLGLPGDEIARLIDEPARLEGTALAFVMSHLACAEESDNPMNGAQLAAFEDARRRLPAARASLANSSGIFLGPAYHFDLARPGVALYGVNPTPGKPNPMKQVIELKGRILQVREIDAPQSVGYGATYRAEGPRRVATVAVGYADGYLRALSGRAAAWIGNSRVPVVGRVSMDLITLDVSDVAEQAARPGSWVELLGPHQAPEELAESGGTIGYEILTALGKRYHRIYLGG